MSYSECFDSLWRCFCLRVPSGKPYRQSIEADSRVDTSVDSGVATSSDASAFTT